LIIEKQKIKHWKINKYLVMLRTFKCRGIQYIPKYKNKSLILCLNLIFFSIKCFRKPFQNGRLRKRSDSWFCITCSSLLILYLQKEAWPVKISRHCFLQSKNITLILKYYTSYYFIFWAFVNFRILVYQW